MSLVRHEYCRRCGSTQLAGGTELGYWQVRPELGAYGLCLSIPYTHLEDAGRSLMRWDGMGSLPSEPAWHEPDVPVPKKVTDWDAALDEIWDTNLEKDREYTAEMERFRLDLNSGRISMRVVMDLLETSKRQKPRTRTRRMQPLLLLQRDRSDHANVVAPQARPDPD